VDCKYERFCLIKVIFNMGSYLSHYSREDWNDTCAKCRRLLLELGEDEFKVVPNGYSSDPVYEFEELRPLEGGVFRFVVFCLWLEKQPLSYYYCQRIVAAHPFVWKICVSWVNYCSS